MKRERVARRVAKRTYETDSRTIIAHLYINVIDCQDNYLLKYEFVAQDLKQALSILMESTESN